MQKLGKQPTDIIRFNESVALELGLSIADSRSVDEWVQILITNPILMERPIVVSDGGAVIGRPPENVFELID